MLGNILGLCTMLRKILTNDSLTLAWKQKPSKVGSWSGSTFPFPCSATGFALGCLEWCWAVVGWIANCHHQVGHLEWAGLPGLPSSTFPPNSLSFSLFLPSPCDLSYIISIQLVSYFSSVYLPTPSLAPLVGQKPNGPNSFSL